MDSTSLLVCSSALLEPARDQTLRVGDFALLASWTEAEKLLGHDDWTAQRCALWPEANSKGLLRGAAPQG